MLALLNQTCDPWIWSSLSIQHLFISYVTFDPIDTSFQFLFYPTWQIGRFWKPAFESLKSLGQIYPRNFPLSTVIDQNVLGWVKQLNQVPLFCFVISVMIFICIVIIVRWFYLPGYLKLFRVVNSPFFTLSIK